MSSRQDPLRRFRSYILLGDGCWEWTGPRTGRGYGVFNLGYVKYPAHRVAYELWAGPIPIGLELDHLCRNRGCVRPDHLEPVTRRENLRRSPLVYATKKRAAKARGAQILARTVCPSGHPYDEVNTAYYRGKRYCRACNRETNRRYYTRKQNG